MNAKREVRVVLATIVAAAVGLSSPAAFAGPKKQKRATNDKITTECVPGSADYDIDKCYKSIKK
jgi:hypothetical protein